VDLLDAYGLTKEDFMESMCEMQFTINNDTNFKDKFDQIDTQTKTALTKHYNRLV
jgi:hypothetical protein